MKATLTRFGHGDSSTLGRLAVPGFAPVYTLEDRYREGPKVPGETRIPAGTYRVTLRTEGGFHDRYSRRFPELHRGMLWLRDVPGFEWILVHCGNTDEDTRGCILVGVAPAFAGGEFQVLSSTKAYRDVYPALAEAAAADDLVLEIHSRVTD